MTGLLGSSQWSILQLLKTSQMHAAFDIRFLACATVEDTLASSPPVTHPGLEFSISLLSPTCGIYAQGDVPHVGAMAFSPSLMWWSVAYHMPGLADTRDLIAGFGFISRQLMVGVGAEEVTSFVGVLSKVPTVVSPFRLASGWLELYSRERDIFDGSIFGESQAAYEQRHGIYQDVSRWSATVKSRLRVGRFVDDQMVDWSSPEFDEGSDSSEV
jgi:hypothetical protein